MHDAVIPSITALPPVARMADEVVAPRGCLIGHASLILVAQLSVPAALFEQHEWIVKTQLRMHKDEQISVLHHWNNKILTTTVGMMRR